MDDGTLFGEAPILQTRHRTKPWKAAKDHTTILIPFQKHLHWTLAVLHKPKGIFHYDSGGESGNQLTLEKAIHKTIPSIKQTTKLKRAQGPLQPNPYICGDCVCLVAYAWCFHSAPWTIDWEKLTSIEGFFPRWRRLIRYTQVAQNAKAGPKTCPPHGRGCRTTRESRCGQASSNIHSIPNWSPGRSQLAGDS